MEGGEDRRGKEEGKEGKGRRRERKEGDGGEGRGWREGRMEGVKGGGGKYVGKLEKCSTSKLICIHPQLHTTYTHTCCPFLLPQCSHQE